MTPASLFDESGRCIAPPQTVIADRPFGDWDRNRDQRLARSLQIRVVQHAKTPAEIIRAQASQKEIA